MRKRSTPVSNFFSLIYFYLFIYLLYFFNKYHIYFFIIQFKNTMIQTVWLVKKNLLFSTMKSLEEGKESKFLPLIGSFFFFFVLFTRNLFLENNQKNSITTRVVSCFPLPLKHFSVTNVS